MLIGAHLQLSEGSPRVVQMTELRKQQLTVKSMKTQEPTANIHTRYWPQFQLVDSPTQLHTHTQVTVE